MIRNLNHDIWSRSKRHNYYHVYDKSVALQNKTSDNLLIIMHYDLLEHFQQLDLNNYYWYQKINDNELKV